MKKKVLNYVASVRFERRFKVMSLASYHCSTLAISPTCVSQRLGDSQNVSQFSIV